MNTTDLSFAPEAVSAMESVGTLISLPPKREILLGRIFEADAYMCSACVRVDAELLDRARRLKVIGSPSTGTDHMDVDEILKRNIKLFDIAKERTLLDSFTATSELAFGLLLALIRKLPSALESAKSGDWAREKFSGSQLYGKKLGILGLGRLGTISARIGQGFGMEVFAHDIRDVQVPGVEMVSFERLLVESDVLTLHIHLTPRTDGIIDTDALEKMKSGAILLNTSRGRIINETAVLEALANGHLRGAALDVIDGEWMTKAERRMHPLLSYARHHENLLVSPHIGGATKESIYGARVFMACRIAKFLREYDSCIVT